ADVRVPAEHLAGDVACDVHDRLVPGSTLSQLRDESVASVMPTALHPCTLPQVAPRCFEAGDVLVGIKGALLACFWPCSSPWKQIPSRLHSAKPLCVPVGVFLESRKQIIIEWYRPPLTSYSLAPANNQETSLEIDLAPREVANLRIPQTSIEC